VTRSTVAIVGAGRVGTALGVLLARAGHPLVAGTGREATRERLSRHLPDVPVRSPGEAASAADVVVLGVPDDKIAGISDELAAAGAFRDGQVVAHLSGSASLDALAAARDAGARVISLHPLQTFPDVEAALERLPGSAVAVTALDEAGFEIGERLAAAVGARPFRIADERKPLYHAAAVFASNYLAVVEAIAERVFRTAGLDDPVPTFAPLAEATLANVLRMGPAAALTGPAVRGDAGTIRANLEALAAEVPEFVPAYVALAAAAVDLATEAGRLEPADRGRVEEALLPWT
jgi:predicted short-subunit dehydrogenase-like oxidoreductase (DUF2520 family)